jgi:hypothetical protein
MKSNSFFIGFGLWFQPIHCKQSSNYFVCLVVWLWSFMLQIVLFPIGLLPMRLIWGCQWLVRLVMLLCFKTKQNVFTWKLEESKSKSNPKKITNYLCACLHVHDFVNFNIIRCQSSSAQHITLVNLVPLLIISDFFLSWSRNSLNPSKPPSYYVRFDWHSTTTCPHPPKLLQNCHT